MINAGSGGIDPSNARPFASYAGGQPQGGGDALYQQPAGGYGGLQSGFGMQGPVPGSRQASGIGSMAMGQTGHARFPSGNLSNQLQQQLGQQYGQAAGRSGLPGGQMLAMNGLGGGRGSPAPGPSQGSALQQRGSLDLSGSGPGLSGPDGQQRGGGGLGISGGFAGSGFAGGGGGMRAGPSGSPARSLGAGGLHASGDLMPMLDAGGSGGNTSMAAAAGGKFSQAAGRQLSAGGGPKADASITFDESDFPSLGGGSARPAGITADGGIANPGGGGSGGAAGPQPITAASATLGPDPYTALSLGKGQEFNMQPEEFPALPGAPRPGPPPASGEAGDASMAEGPGGEGQGQPQASQLGRALGGDPQSGSGPGVGLPPGHPNHDQMQRFYQQQAAARGATGGAAASGDPKAAGAVGGAQGQPDRFGLLGLLSVIRMTDPDLTTLALGTDLTTLGLNLNSPDNLHKTFASPWADGPLKAEPDFKVPACYMHNPPRLQPGYFAKFQQDTLFYIFYSMPGDEAQLLAADELSARQWWFHKEFKLWLTRIPNTEPIMKTERFERGSYLVFDTTTWDAVRKDNFVVHYDSLERPPDLPRPAPGSGAAAPGAGPGGASAVKPPGAGGLAPGGAL